MSIMALVGGAVPLASAGTAIRGVDVLPEIPDKDVAAQFVGVSESWRQYFIDARAAQRLDDPLARCLAWPDLPGNAWPEGHARAHCEYHFAPVPTPEEVAAYLDAGDVQALEARLRAEFGRHGDPDDGAETLHLFHAGILELEAEARGRLTSRWLELAPTSAYAAVARGDHFLMEGWDARGGKYAGDTSAERFSAMRKHFDDAEQQYRWALELDPRSARAYIGLMRIGTVDSRRELEEWAFERATTVAPGCAEIAVYALQALQPRWGGSIELMVSYAASLEPKVERSPLFANQLSAPYAELARIAIEADHYTADVAGLLDEAVSMSSNESALYSAAEVALKRNDGSETEVAKGVALLLQQERFAGLSPWQARQLAQHLLRYEPEWTLSILSRAASREPDNSYGNYLIGEALRQLGHFDSAEHHYTVALAADDGNRHPSLRQLLGMWLFNAGLPQQTAAERARPLLQQLRDSYPDDAAGVGLEILLRLYQGETVLQQDLVDYIAVADRNDALQAWLVERYEGMLEEADRAGTPGVEAG